MKMALAGKTPSGDHALRIDGIPGVQKEIPGLRKRAGREPAYARSGSKLAETGPVQAGERITVYVQDNQSQRGLRVRVESIHPDGVLFGRVEQLISRAVLTQEVNGIKLADHVRIPSMDYVWVVERR